MGAEIPKQYLQLNNRTVIEHTLHRLASVPTLSGIVVVLGAEDPYWCDIKLPEQPKIILAKGGEERCHSVLNGLNALSEKADPGDWVLVHDAARPCVRAEDILKLMEQTSRHPVGGLLAAPVTDTVKRVADNGDVIQTVDRIGLWRALTPQLFCLGSLIGALEAALQQDAMVTDEAAAMELAGKLPCVVEGQVDNIKITRPEDLKLASYYLESQLRDTGE